VHAIVLAIVLTDSNQINPEPWPGEAAGRINFAVDFRCGFPMHYSHSCEIMIFDIHSDIMV
jgi:hypothetical protein